MKHETPKIFLIVNARNLVETKNSYVQNVASEKNFDPRENKSFFMLGVVSHFDFGLQCHLVDSVRTSFVQFEQI